MESTKLKKEFKLSYDTEETEDHTIDAETLGESLTQLAKLLKHSDKLLNGEDSETEIEVKAHSPGSFEIEMVAWLSQGGVDYLKALGIGTAFTGAGVGGLFGVIKALKGQVVRERILQSNGNSKIITDDHEVECPPEVVSLLDSYAVMKGLETVISKPTKGQPNAKVKFSSGTDTNVNPIVISEEQLDFFKAPPRKNLEEKLVTEEHKDIIFTVVAFESKTGWKMKIPPSNEELTVKMADESFMERINGGDKKFVKGERFVVSLKTTEKKLDGKVTTVREITKVLRHRAYADRKVL